MIVSRIIFDLLDAFEDLSFEGKMICFCEDFKQTLPVCLGKGRDAIVDSCLQRISFWSEIKILRLIINMRLQDLSLNEEGRRDATRFAQKVLDIGNETTTFLLDDDDKGKAP